MVKSGIGALSTWYQTSLFWRLLAYTPRQTLQLHRVQRFRPVLNLHFSTDGVPHFPPDHYNLNSTNLNSTNLLDCLGFGLTFDFVSPGIFVLVLPTPFCVGFFLTEDSYYVELYSSVWIDLFFIHNSFEISISHGM